MKDGQQARQPKTSHRHSTGLDPSGLDSSRRHPSGRHPSGRPTIGLLAGMGVRSTAPFLDFIVEECQRQLGTRHEADYPPMIVFSWPIPFYFDRELDHDDLREAIASGLEWLESTGVDFIAMPCNSAHVYFSELVERISVPMIDMVQEAADRVPEGTGTVALLATRSTRDSGLYQRALEDRGVSVVCTEDIQKRLDGTLMRIREVSDLSEPRAMFRAVLSDLRERGVDVGLIACTDLNYLVEDGPPLPLLDAGRMLAARVVTQWQSILNTEAPIGGDT